jgi:hypothetical protein
MTKQEYTTNILKVCESFIGIKEISGNKGWEDKKFQEKMELVGWKVNEAWCAYVTELVYKLAIVEDTSKWKDNKFVQLLDKLFSGSCVQTRTNFIKKGTQYFTFTKTPELGSIVIFQTYSNGEPSWSGHMGIVKEVQQERFLSYEGNTNSQGGREGIEFAVMKRQLSFDVPKKGTKLVLSGFLTLKDDINV